ncbi:MAG: hypothetical protein RLY93_12890 [Sumerlaeia bacterium]
MRCFSKKGRALAAAGVCAFAGTLAAATPDGLQVTRENGVQLSRDGQTLSARPLALTVTEWRGSADAAGKPSSTTAAPENTVGSLLAEEEVRSQLTAIGQVSWPLSGDALISNSLGDAAKWHSEERGLRGWVRWADGEGYLRVFGAIENADPETFGDERIVTVRFSVPIDGAEDGELEWQGHLNGSQQALANAEIQDTFSIAAGATGAISRYMWGGLTGPWGGVGVGLPPDQPRLHRVLWDGPQGELAIEIDVALSAHLTSSPHQVPLEYWVFPFPGEFGFRGMTRAYYDLAPEAFANRSKSQGQWMPFTQVNHVQRPEDFRFKYHEYHPNVSVAYNNQNDIWSLVYCEPTVQWVQMPAGMARDTAELFPYIDSLDTAQGSAVRSSGSYGPDGQFSTTFAIFPWADGARIPMNSNPRIPRTDRNPVNGFDLSWQPYSDLLARQQSAEPLAWKGGGVAERNVIQAQGRALRLADGSSAFQTIPAGRPGASELEVTVRYLAGENTRLMVRGASGDTKTLAPDAPHVWQRQTVAVDPGATNPRLELIAQGGEVLIDHVDARPAGDPSAGNLLENAGFEATAADAEAVTGFYLDSFEGWEAVQLDYRAANNALSPYPLTFHPATGAVGQINMWHNFAFAEEAARRVHQNGHLLMANTALYKFGWSGPLLDVLGIETNWGGGEHLTPPSIDMMDFIRTLSYQKPYCFLQNVPFDRFRGKKVEQYFARCLHYGMWPGFFSHDAASDPYWENARLYNEDRWLSLKFMAPQGLLTSMGWEPITLASLDRPDLLAERWGGGAYRGTPLNTRRVGFTLYNPSDVGRRGRVTLDPALFGDSPDVVAWDLIQGKRLSLSEDGRSFEADVAPLDVRAILVFRRDRESLETETRGARRAMAELADKWRRHGMIPGKMADEAEAFAGSSLTDPGRALATLAAWEKTLAPSLEDLYRDIEWTRQAAFLRTLESLLWQEIEGDRFEPMVPAVASPGYPLRIQLPERDGALLVRAGWGGELTRLPLDDHTATLLVSGDAPLGGEIRVVVTETGRGASLEERLLYEALLPIVPPVELGDIPAETVFRDRGRATLSVHNNLVEDLAARIRVEGLPAGLSATVEPAADLLLPDGETQELAIVFQPQGTSGEITAPVTVSLIGDQGQPLSKASFRVVRLSQESSLLRESSVEVATDSNFWGYTPRPLNDGVTDTSNKDWSEAAWASEEGLQPHWATFLLKEPRTLSRVAIHWAMDSNVHQTSQFVRIEGRTSPTAPWELLAEVRPGQPEERSEVSFEPRTLRELRVYQPTGSGPAARPGILWIEEVEAR